MKRTNAIILSIISAFAIGASSALILARPEINATPAYVLRDYNGKLAVFSSNEDKPISVFEIYTHLLPEKDVIALRYGITVDTPSQLNSMLEDFGA